MVGSRVRVTTALTAMVTHMRTDSLTWICSGEKAMAVNPTARPRAFASTGVAT
jgi:hypothetical protein